MAASLKPPKNVPGLKVRNPRTQARIRRDSLWQIYLPLGLALVAVLAAMAWFIFFASVPTLSAFADVSLIFLILPALVLGLIVLVVFGALGFGVWYLRRELPYLFKRAQDLAAQLAQRTKLATAQVTDRILSMRAFMAGAQKTADNLRSIFTPPGRTK